MKAKSMNYLFIRLKFVGVTDMSQVIVRKIIKSIKID